MTQEIIYNRDYFNGKNSFFWKFGYGKFSQFYFNGLFKPLDKYIREVKIGKVLDAGCAYGLMLKKFPLSWQKFGLDISDYAIGVAKKKVPEALFFSRSIDGDLPFEENFFDLVLLNDVLEHLKNPEIALRNIYKILKRGGILYITTPNLNFVRKILLSRIDKAEHHISMFSHSRLKALIVFLGFSIEEQYTSFYSFCFKSNIGMESVLVCKK